MASTRRKVTRRAKAPIKVGPAKQVNVHEAKTHLSRLLDEALAGQVVLVTRRGKPIVRLEPVDPVLRRPVFGSMRGLIKFDDSFFDPLPDDELEAWGQA